MRQRPQYIFLTFCVGNLCKVFLFPVWQTNTETGVTQVLSMPFIKCYIIMTISCWDNARQQQFPILFLNLQRFAWEFQSLITSLFILHINATHMRRVCVRAFHCLYVYFPSALEQKKEAPFALCLFGSDYIFHTQTIPCIVYFLIRVQSPSIPNAHAYLPCQ